MKSAVAHVPVRLEIPALAPTAPPCFESRTQWLDWLAAAFDADRGDSGPLILEAGRPVRFNRALNFCADCTRGHMNAMIRAGRCNPRALVADERQEAACAE